MSLYDAFGVPIAIGIMGDVRNLKPTVESNPRTHGWVTPPKRDDTVKRRELVKKRSGSSWHKGGFEPEEVYSGDLLKRMHEETDRELEKHRWPGQKDFKDAKKRTGRALSSNDFTRMVLKLCPNLVCEDSLNAKHCAAFYEVIYNPATGKRQKRYTAACFRKGYIPEFTVVKADAADLISSSDCITYGWRTVLQRLIQQKVLRYRDAIEIFGEVHHQDLRGKNWALAVAAFR